MESGRGGMGSHKHGVSGHSRPNPVNLRQVARLLNGVTDARAALRERRRHDGMTEDAVAVFAAEAKPKQKKRKKQKKRGRKQSRGSS